MFAAPRVPYMVCLRRPTFPRLSMPSGICRHISRSYVPSAWARLMSVDLWGLFVRHPSGNRHFKYSMGCVGANTSDAASCAEQALGAFVSRATKRERTIPVDSVRRPTTGPRPSCRAPPPNRRCRPPPRAHPIHVQMPRPTHHVGVEDIAAGVVGVPL